MEITAVALIVAIASLFGFRMYLTKRNDKKALINEVKAQALALFLYAEKQDWIGAEKMKFAVEKIMKIVDDSVLSKVIGRNTVERWMQSLYDSVKKYLEQINK
jgi:hypothetical protein